MAKFASSMLEQIRLIDIASIIEPYVEFKSKGRDLWGLCPFHSEKSPSFKVDIEKGFFKCFGCDAKGNGITFIMRKLGFSYPDAVLYLAEKYGIDITYDKEEYAYSKDILSLHEEIQKISRKLFYSEIGVEARQYIFSRNFSEDDINEFGIGYLSADVDYSEIYKMFPRDILYNSGFFKESKYGNPSPRFFSRLMLPIKNITGSISAFAGRSLDGSNPKYLNSAESSIFHKSYTLFNIDKAKDSINKSRQAIIVEGYFDVLRLYKSGFKNVVAPMGTALTKEQISLLKRYADEIIIMFDGDTAGEKAASRSLERFTETGIFPKVIFLPTGDDPDSFILNYGVDKFKEIYEKREDLFVYIIKKYAQLSKDDFNYKLARYKSIKNMLLKIEDPHIKDYYIEIAADIFNLKKENIQEELVRSRYKRDLKLNKNLSENLYLCEMDFVACLSHLPVDVIDSLLSNMNLEMVNSDEIKNILKKILEFLPNISDIRQITHELGSQFIDIAMREVDIDNAYSEAIKNKNQIELNFLKRRQNHLIEEMQKTTNDVDKINLLQELNNITKLITSKNKVTGNE